MKFQCPISGDIISRTKEAGSAGERTLVVSYEEDSLHVQAGDCCYDRIVSPAYIPLPHDGATTARIRIKGNLGEERKDDLTRFSILRPMEIEKMELAVTEHGVGRSMIEDEDK